MTSVEWEVRGFRKARWPVSFWWVLDFFHYLGGGVCHQIADRSLQLAGVPLPLCARDTGTYLGLTLGLVAIVLLRRTRASMLPWWPLLVAFGVFVAAWGADGLNSYLVLLRLPHVYEPSNALRLLTGTLEGLALILVVWPVAAFTFWRETERRRVIRARELAALLATALALVALLSQPFDVPLAIAGAVSGLGLLGMFTLLNALLLTVALRREGTGEKARDLLPLLLIAAGLALVELLLLSTLRHWLLPF